MKINWHITLAFGALLTLSSCASSYEMGSSIPNDDIFYSSGGERQTEKASRTLASNGSASGNDVLDNYVTDRRRNNSSREPYLDRADEPSQRMSAQTNNNPFWNSPNLNIGMGFGNAGFFGARRYMLYDPFMPPFFAMSSPWSCMGGGFGFNDPFMGGMGMGFGNPYMGGGFGNPYMGGGFGNPWMGGGFGNPWMGGGFGNPWMGGGFGNPWMGGGFGNPWMGGGFNDPRFGGGNIYNANGKRVEYQTGRPDYTGRSGTGRTGGSQRNDSGSNNNDNGRTIAVPAGRTPIQSDIRRGGVRTESAPNRNQTQPRQAQPIRSQPEIRERNPRQQAPEIRQPNSRQAPQPRQQQPQMESRPQRDISPSRGGFPSAPSTPSAPAGRSGGRSPR